MDRPNRSHPTLSPLTTYPTSPSASTSYLYPSTSIPTTPSILSRTSSQTRLRPSVSSPQAIPNSKSTSTLQKPTSTTNDKRKRRSIRNKNESEDDWLTRTASTLTLTRLEEKGQSWLAARNSSTSLTGGEVGDDEYDPYSPQWNRSQVQSQMASQRGSRSRLQSRRGSMGGVPEMNEEEVVGPDFVDVDEEDEEEEEGEEVDEGEMKKVVMGRVGGWVDWAVGWMDFRGEGEEEGEDDNVEEGREGGSKEGPDPVELQKRLRRKKKRDEELEGGDGEKGVVRPPPEDGQAGTWSDAKWLLGVATKVAL